MAREVSWFTCQSAYTLATDLENTEHVVCACFTALDWHALFERFRMLTGRNEAA